MVILLIDGDLIRYSASRAPKLYYPDGYSRTKEEIEANCEAWLHKLFQELEEKYNVIPTHYKLFLEGHNNFRGFIYPQYKANRRVREKPPMLDYARDYLIEHYNAFISNGVETDDSIYATWSILKKWNKDIQVIICSMDRDLRALPCWYFNTNHLSRELHKITKEEALKNFYGAMLMGDKEDNIEGLKAIGEVKAAKILVGLTTKRQMLMRTYREYIKHYGRKARRMFELNYFLLRLVSEGVEIPTDFEEITFNL